MIRAATGVVYIFKHLSNGTPSFGSRACPWRAVFEALRCKSFSDTPENRTRKEFCPDEKSAHTSATSYCQYTEAKVSELLTALRVTDALTLALNGFKEGKTLTCRTITALISALSRAGDTNGVLQAGLLVRNTYPEYWTQQISFEHYHAEALYRSGRARDAIAKFEDLFLKHPNHRDKISNLLTFFAIYLLSEDLVDEVELLVQMCTRLSNRGFFHPIANVWKVLFVAKKKRYHATAWRVVSREHRDEAKKFIDRKVSGILVSAVEQDSIDIVHRLVGVVFLLKMESRYSSVLSFLLEFYCKYDR